MITITAEIRIPPDMKQYVEFQDEQKELVRNALMLYQYITDNTISHGRAAEILGVPKWQLLELYDRMGMAYLDLTEEEVREDIESYYMAKRDIA